MPPDSQSSERLLPAIGLRLLSVALFACMNTGIKLAEQRGAALGEILFFRQLGASALVSAVVLAGPGIGSLRSARMGAHVSRAAVGLVSMAFTFAALLALPLAEATTIGFSMPIFATILGAVVLGEPTGWRRWAAVLTGFVGVLIVTRPGVGGQFPLWGGLCGLAAAFLTAVVSILLRQLGRSERPLTTVFWFSTLSLVPLGIAYALAARAHPPLVWLVLAAIGLFGGAAQLAMTGSLARGAVSLVVPMDYTSLVWATALGWLVFGTLPDRATWIGAPVVVASACTSSGASMSAAAPRPGRRRRRASARAPAVARAPGRAAAARAETSPGRCAVNSPSASATSMSVTASALRWKKLSPASA